MSLEFIKNRENARHLATAVRQQRQINYFVQSQVQENISDAYLLTWAERNYQSNDFFLNWIKTIFKTDNFLSFYKYMRYPLPSAKIVNDDIKTQLKRVFYAEDSFSKYIIKGKETSIPTELEANELNETIFNAYLFNYNDIIVCDLKDINTPYRSQVCIDDVISIESYNGKIERLCYEAEINDDTDNEIKGFLYIDKYSYIFYDREFNVILDIPHDLGYCPAEYVSNEAFSTDNDVVRKSIFSYIIQELEEYVFLNTILKMTEPNGAIPVVTKLKTTETSRDGAEVKGVSDQQPMSAGNLTSQQSKKAGGDFSKTNSPLQAGTIYNIPQIKKSDNSIDMDLVKNYINFFYIPTECLKYLNDRIKEIEVSIINSVLGDYQEQNQSAKNELQVSKSYANKQDKLRSVSLALSKLRTNLDRTFLGLKYGIENVFVEYFFGSDFFLETESEIYSLIEKAPNTYERRSLLSRLSQNKNKFSPSKAQREKLLYELMPYTSDKDFDTALKENLVSDQNKILQIQFNHYISLFEAKYGDILNFYINLDASNSEKLIVINNLLLDLIKSSTTNT
jgi:hypothetical protein